MTDKLKPSDPTNEVKPAPLPPETSREPQGNVLHVRDAVMTLIAAQQKHCELCAESRPLEAARAIVGDYFAGLLAPAPPSPEATLPRDLLPPNTPANPSEGEISHTHKEEGADFSTKSCGLPEPEICRRKGWGVGTRLVGDEGYGPTVIEITAIGESHLLAKTITHNGEIPTWAEHEGNWTLSAREWKSP
jgi:hypothetical protein